MLTINRSGSTVTVTAESQDGRAFLDGNIRFDGANATGLSVRSFESADSAKLVSGGVDFDLAVFKSPGAFDSFVFTLDPNVTMTVNGAFDTVVTGDPLDPGSPVDPVGPVGPVDPEYAGLLTIKQVGSKVTVTATSQDGKAVLDGSIRAEASALGGLTTRNLESNDRAELTAGIIEFELQVFDSPGLFDEFSFNVDPGSRLIVDGAFDVMFI